MGTSHAGVGFPGMISKDANKDTELMRRILELAARYDDQERTECDSWPGSDSHDDSYVAEPVPLSEPLAMPSPPKTSR